MVGFVGGLLTVNLEVIDVLLDELLPGADENFISSLGSFALKN